LTLLARDGKYTGAAVIAGTRAVKERLWRRVERSRAKQPEGVPSAVSEGVEWVKPGITVPVRYLRGESKLRHATVQEVSED
jgi:bifunctional non-homologous end joining protein LigD